MSTMAPETPPAAPRGAAGSSTTPRPAGRGGLFGEKLGPLPMWGWVAILGGALVAWRMIASHYANAAATAAGASSTDTTTPADQVPQFVNQVYTTTTPPVQTPPPPPTPTPTPQPKQQLTRTWESLGGSTYAEVAMRLLGNTNVANLHPANKAAVAWVNGPYKKNHHAKMPKGLLFTYTEGTVTSKTAAK